MISLNECCVLRVAARVERGGFPIWFFCDITWQYASVFSKFSHSLSIIVLVSTVLCCCCSSSCLVLQLCTSLVAIFLEVPLAIVQWAHLTRLQPTWDAMEVKGVIAYAPGDGALLACGRCLIRLAFDTEVHDVVATNGAIVNNDIWIYAF